jgi:hypothetical protein
MSAWLDALFGRIFNRGTEIALSKGLDFKAPLAAALNTATKITEISVADASLTAPMVAAEASSAAVPVVLRVPLTAAATGTADDVTLYSATAPYAFRVLDVWARIDTAVGGSTVQVRTASGGGGSALSSSLSSASAGVARNNDTAERTVAAGGSVFIRRSDRAVAGAVFLLVEKT